MKRTTVYLPEDLKRDLEEMAESTGRSQADLIREGVRRMVGAKNPPKPRVPLFRSDTPTLADEVDERLRGQLDHGVFP